MVVGSGADGCSVVNGRRGASRREYSDGGACARRGEPPLPHGGKVKWTGASDKERQAGRG